MACSDARAYFTLVRVGGLSREVQMAANESEEDRLIRQQVWVDVISLSSSVTFQRLKAALHYAVGRACEDVG